jgi:hypothetical protein
MKGSETQTDNAGHKFINIAQASVIALLITEDFQTM